MLGRSVSKALRAQCTRSLATQASGRTEVTHLSNGSIVATKTNASAPSASVGLVLGSGSAAENPYNNGVSSVLTNLYHLDPRAAQHGLLPTSKVGRDYQAYVVSSRPGKLEQQVSHLREAVLMRDVTQNFENAKKAAISQAIQFEERDHAGRVMEHLHSTAFQNTPLSLPRRGTVESLETLEASDLQAFVANHFAAPNSVIVGTGNVSHAELVEAVEKATLPFSTDEFTISKQESTFLGSEVRLRDDTLPKAWMAIAVEGESLSSPDFYTAQVAAEIFGSYNAFEPRSRLQGVKLIDKIQEYGLCESFKHFSKSYVDSGLWGFATVSTSFGAIDDLMHFTLKQWNRLSVSVTETEVFRGKAQLKLKLAQVEANNDIRSAHRLGVNVLAKNNLSDLDEAFKKIDSVAVKDVKQWASKRLWDQDIAVAGTGQIEGLLDYMRLRNDMSMMRW